MFCSGCGHALESGQLLCPQCGRTTAPAAPVAPPAAVPNMAFELATYANRVRALSTVWFIYGGLVAITGLAGLTFANAFLNGGLAPWMHGLQAHGYFPFGVGPAFLRFAWTMILLRASLAFIAGWGLMERTPWGRVVAIVAAFLSILKIPFGTAIAIWTLVSLLGYRNTTLYDQL